MVEAEELRFFDDYRRNSRVGSCGEDVERVAVSVRLPNDVLHEMVIVERAHELDGIEVIHHVDVDVDVPDNGYR